MSTQPNSPVLHLVSEPVSSPRSYRTRGRGKNKNKIVHARLNQQQKLLAESLQEIFDSRNKQTLFGENYTPLCVRMFEDSIAPVHTPENLFSKGTDCKLVAPLKNGYFVESNINSIPNLIEMINGPPSYVVQYDISRVQSIHVFNKFDILRGQKLTHLWKESHSSNNGRLFSIWLSPYSEFVARIDLANKLVEIVSNSQHFKILEHSKLSQNTDLEKPVINWNFHKELVAFTEYRTVGQGTIEICSKDAVANLVDSGTIFRIEPIGSIRASTNSVTTSN